MLIDDTYLSIFFLTIISCYAFPAKLEEEEILLCFIPSAQVLKHEKYLFYYHWRIWRSKIKFHFRLKTLHLQTHSEIKKKVGVKKKVFENSLYLTLKRSSYHVALFCFHYRHKVKLQAIEQTHWYVLRQFWSFIN